MTFAKLLTEEQLIVAPGAYDSLSALIIEQLDFPLIYFSGLANEASELGLPDLGLTTASEITERVNKVVQRVSTPVVCDADTGFGGPLNVLRTVQMMESAGVAAIHLEDQTFPKRCGLLSGKTVVTPDEFAETISIAVEARRSQDFCIIARTDAKTAEGITGVIDRLNLYAERGANAAMLGDFYTLEEYEKIATSVSVPLIAIAADPDNFNKQPDYTFSEWENARIRIVLYWYLPLFAAVKSVNDSLKSLKENGHISGKLNQIAGYNTYADLTDLEFWTAFAEKFASSR